jgi:protein SMG6
LQYESLQRKRDEKNRLRLKEKEHKFDGGNLRRETWIHPEGGRRVHRTAPLDPLAGNTAGDSSDEEELKHMDLDEVKRRFVTSFLHVQGKLITKIGMETFTQCATQMLREFHLLINYTTAGAALDTQPLLQLMALNMFAIDCTQLRGE